MLPFRAILNAFCCCCCCWCCSNELKWEMPISSRLLLRRRAPTPLSPWRSELDRRSSMSSTTRSELERPLKSVMIVGLSGSDREFALVVESGGARGCTKLAPRVDPRLLDTPWACMRAWEQKLMLDLRRLLWRSKVFCAENGEGRTRYLEIEIYTYLTQFNKLTMQASLATYIMSPSCKFRSQLGFMIT